MEIEVSAAERFPAADALRVEHDEIRAALARAVMEEGPVGAAARRVAKRCVPHFEEEERYVFPVFGLLHHLARGEVRAEMAAVLPLVSVLRARHEHLRKHHQAIFSSIGALLTAAHKTGNRDVAGFAHRLWIHQRIEDVIIYPAALFIGRYMREQLQPRAAPGAKRRALSLKPGDSGALAGISPHRPRKALRGIECCNEVM